MRLAAVVPAEMHACVLEPGIVQIRDADGVVAGVDIAHLLGWHGPETQPPGDWVRGAAHQLLDQVQAEIAEATTEPWPQGGSEALATPHAELTADGDAVRLLYGDPAAPVLELAPLPLADVLRLS